MNDHTMTDYDIVSHATPRSRDARHRISSSYDDDTGETYSTRSRTGIRLNLPSAIQFGQTITLDAYRQWDALTNPS